MRVNEVFADEMEPYDRRKSQSASYPMAQIPAGCVHLRDDRKKTAWMAEVGSFLLAPVPVTRGLYDAIVRTERYGIEEDEVLAECPVTDVSWLDAIRFCNAMSRRSGFKACYAIGEDGETVAFDGQADGYRLPTEAEWQHACRAGTDGYRYGDLDEIAWYRDNAGGAVRIVGGKLPNPWGLYDMLGNVWEWCWDVYDAQVYGAYRIFRGGSWAEEARGCGATVRRRSHPAFRIDDLGFRLARSCPESAFSDSIYI
ncbi:Formylglycine-generating enzyme, required for sulfatase activity, contains SUMF1/FGE domain [Cohnella sp. OV330]|nr:Formylglycine-generating enzyme, required for sulfatase activity, contains SUMF1/FGE domain [Cohnella sp. OV330]